MLTPSRWCGLVRPLSEQSRRNVGRTRWGGWNGSNTEPHIAAIAKLRIAMLCASAATSFRQRSSGSFSPGRGQRKLMRNSISPLGPHTSIP